MSRLASAGPIRRIGVLRALQLGDLLCAVPAMRALRAAFPRASILLVGLPWARAFASRFRRYVDGFLEFPGYPGLPERTPDLAAIPGFLSRSRARQFDVVIQLHGSGEITNPVALSMGGRTTAGFFRTGQFCPDADWFLPYPENEPEPRRLLDLMRFLGVPARGEQLEFPLSAQDRRAARRAVGSRLAGQRYVCVHPGARAPERRWTPMAFARVADALAARGLTVALTGVREEAAITAEVTRRMHAPAVDLAGRLPLGGLAALLAGASALLSNDTAVSHLAAALHVPSVVIYTASEPARWAPLDRKLHRIVRGARCDVRSAGARCEAVRSADDEREAVERAIAEALDLLHGEDLYAA